MSIHQDEMNSANQEWAARCRKQRVTNMYKSSAEFFSMQKIADKMIQNLIDGRLSRAGDQLKVLDFPPGSTVLDIGAGPGTLAVPLAKSGCRVTVVEPSEPMNLAMEKYKLHCMVDADIGVMQNTWENVDLDPDMKYDYVISSYSLNMPDLEDALWKMHNAARKQVHIFWFMKDPYWEVVYAALWKKLHGVEYCSKPNADIVWNCLYQMGIYANLSVSPMNDLRGYPDIAAVTSDYADRMDAHEDWQKKIIGEYLQDIMIKGEGGQLFFPDAGLDAHIYWDVHSPGNYDEH